MSLSPAELRNFCQTVIACADAYAACEPSRTVQALHRRAVGYAKQALATLAAEDAPTRVEKAGEGR